MRYAIAFFSTTTILSVLGSLLYFYFAETLIAAACIILAVFILSISWAFGKHELNEIIDPIRERYRMSIIASKTKGLYENIEEAAAALNLDLSWAKNQIRRENVHFRRAGFVESLPSWIVKQALPFLAVSAPKWIIAIIIGVLVIRFHEDIIPHKKEEKNQSMQNEITLQDEISGNIKKGEDKIDSAIDVSDYCIKAHSNQDVIVLSNEGCN